MCNLLNTLNIVLTYSIDDFSGLLIRMQNLDEIQDDNAHKHSKQLLRYVIDYSRYKRVYHDCAY